ncbi:hypothetical protein HGG76_27520 [Ochrobactrum tritici]|uniref:Uncharacterized protein n=1 Tax=Brucella tritici TaxID=94626 RepID=A0A7X6FVD8_9HYPH|nr:hypothetical protein [Brucella tritici]
MKKYLLFIGFLLISLTTHASTHALGQSSQMASLMGTSVNLETKLTQHNETFQHYFSEDIAAGPYSLESGTLPPGVVMNLHSVIGHPTSVGVYTFTITGFDLNGNVDRVTYTVRVLPWDPNVAHDAVFLELNLTFLRFISGIM